MLTELEKQVIAAIQGDMLIVAHPYAQIAADLQIDEAMLLETLNSLVQRGVIRRFGATLRHQKSGFKANAMTAWRVDEERIEAVGKIMAKFKEVSHCYRRDPTTPWPYNLYTMIHGINEQHCRKTAKKMSETANVHDFCLLFSKRELKKTSMKYFPKADTEEKN